MSSTYNINGRMLVLALLAGMIVRLVALGGVDYVVSAHDEGTYDRIGWNLVQTGIYSLDFESPYSPTLARPPLQSFMLAAIYRIFGHSIEIARIFQILLSLVTVITFYFGLRRFDPLLATIMLWLGMLSPFDAAIAPRLMSEPLCEFLMVLAFSFPWLMNRSYVWIATGISLGLLILARDVYAPLAICVAVAPVLPMMRTIYGRYNARHAIIALLAAAAVIAPWTYRNYRVSSYFVLVSKGLMWENLWVGSWEDFHHRWNGEPYSTPEPPYLDNNEKSKVEATFHTNRDPTMKELFLNRFHYQPLRIIGRWLEREPLLWIGTRCPVWFKPRWMASGTAVFLLIKSGFFVLNALLLVLGVAGMVVALRRRSPLLWFALPVVFTAIIYLPFHDTETRYSQPVFPFVMMFAVIAVLFLVDRGSELIVAMASATRAGSKSVRSLFRAISGQPNAKSRRTEEMLGSYLDKKCNSPITL